MSHQAIFIHSLFRVGSTYLFNVFRRKSDFTCYQEPLHEIAFFAKNAPELLIVEQDKTHILRHPSISAPYFQELYEAWLVWKDILTEDSIYRNYFSPEKKDIGIKYWQSLINNNKNRSVFQECRTSNRIQSIKKELNGYHIYLWRNPWDQWWSYKINPYFDVANQLITQATDPPTPIILLKESLKIEEYALTNLATAFSDHFKKNLTSEESYLIFYMLWCLGLKEGMKHADLLINIDMLSDQSSYQYSISEELAKDNIIELDFSDCHIPNSIYTDNDYSFFLPLEEKVHDWLKQGGWAQNEISQLLVMRQQYQPKAWYTQSSTALANNSNLEQAVRARNLARYFETSLAQQTRKLSTETCVLKTEIQKETSHANALKQEAFLAENRAQQEANRAELAEQRALAAENRAQQEASRLLQAEQRVQNADLLASQAYQRASNAEHLVAQLELRAREADLIALQARQQTTDQTTLTNELNAQLKRQLLEIQTLKSQLDQQQQTLLTTEQLNEQLQIKANELGGHSHYWYTSYQALEQILEASKTIDRVEYATLEERVRFLSTNSHHWYTVAVQHQQLLNAVYSSTSWKITYPIRSSKLILKSFLTPYKTIKKITKQLILRFNKKLYQYPRIRLQALALIKRLPFSLEQHLKLLIQVNTPPIQTPTHIEQSSRETRTFDTPLPIQAQATYEILKRL